MDRYIIYVDDDPDDRMIMEDAFLNIPDYELIVFNNGNKLLDHLKVERDPLPSLVILDINMPFFSGLDVLKVLRTDPQYNDIPVVMFSTSSNQLDKQNSKAMGAELVVKPLSYKEAVNTCKSLVAYCRR